MGIDVGIFLIALGAILTFAVDWTVGGLDLKAVGWILMAAGVAGLILFSTSGIGAVFRSRLRLRNIRCAMLPAPTTTRHHRHRADAGDDARQDSRPGI